MIDDRLINLTESVRALIHQNDTDILTGDEEETEVQNQAQAQ